MFSSQQSPREGKIPLAKSVGGYLKRERRDIFFGMSTFDKSLLAKCPFPVMTKE
jgi:hypothetical protein